MRFNLLILLLSLAVSSTWFYYQETNVRETIVAADYKITVADGDSFTIGNRKLRLKGIDAPEWRQTCADATGVIWACGKAAHGALLSLLAEPGLSCLSEISDRFGRALATCSNSRTPDIGAAQVKAGMAMSDEFHDLRTYGDEEDEAEAAKRGIWRGAFITPTDWRATHPRGPAATAP